MVKRKNSITASLEEADAEHLLRNRAMITEKLQALIPRLSQAINEFQRSGYAEVLRTFPDVFNGVDRLTAVEQRRRLFRRDKTVPWKRKLLLEFSEYDGMTCVSPGCGKRIPLELLNLFPEMLFCPDCEGKNLQHKTVRIIVSGQEYFPLLEVA